MPAGSIGVLGRIFGPHEQETYRQHLRRLEEASIRDYTPASKAASLMTAMMMMQHGDKDKPVDRETFNAMRRTLEKNTAFRQMMEDPKVTAYVRKNDTKALFIAFAAAEKQRQDTLDAKYKRPEEKELVAMDAELLKTAMNGLRDSAGSAPTSGSPENERRGKLFTEMMKRMEHARSLAEQGIQLSGESTKALVDAVKAYNDGGKQHVKPGGEKRAAGFLQSMVILKNYMPAADFNRYCRHMNASRDITDPKDINYAEPSAFEPQRLNGAKPAKELMAENRRRMQDSFVVDTAAEALAIRQLSGGDPNRLIAPEALRAQKEKLSEPGSAFMKVMEDEKARADLEHLADMGEAEEVVGDLGREIERRERELQEQARKRVVRTAQGEINRSIQRLTSGTLNNRYFTEQYLANILASEQLAVGARGDEVITNGAFRARAEELRKDPAFQRLADRYINDPAYRRQMNNELQRDRSAQALAGELQAERQPAHARREPEQPVRRAEPEQPVVQPPAQQVVG